MPKTNQRPLVMVAIYLTGHQLNPDSISQVLGTHLSRSQKKGGAKALTGKGIAEIGMWVLEVESESRSVSDLMDELFQKIGNPLLRLDELEGVENAILDVFVAQDEKAIGKDSVCFAMTQVQIVRLGQLGLSICATVM